MCVGGGVSVTRGAGGAFQLHCLPSCACERGGSEKKTPSALPRSKRRGEECSWAD